MSEAVCLISRDSIKREDFLDFVRRLGGIVIEDSNEIYDAIVSNKEETVWLVLNNQELKYFDPDRQDKISEKLGGKPKTCILLEISRQAGSQRLAIEIAYQFSKRWSCVLDNLRNQIFSSDAFDRLLSIGQVFDN